MSASNEWRREGIVCPPCSSRPGWESCSCTGASLVIKHKNSPHEIFSQINSSQAACKASQLSSVHSVWALMMSSLQHSCATSSPIVPVSHHNVAIFLCSETYLRKIHAMCMCTNVWVLLEHYTVKCIHFTLKHLHSKMEDSCIVNLFLQLYNFYNTNVKWQLRWGLWALWIVWPCTSNKLTGWHTETIQFLLCVYSLCYLVPQYSQH